MENTVITMVIRLELKKTIVYMDPKDAKELFLQLDPIVRAFSKITLGESAWEQLRFNVSFKDVSNEIMRQYFSASGVEQLLMDLETGLSLERRLCQQK